MGKGKEFDREGYRITITSKNVPLSEAMENHVFDKISKIERFTDHILDIHVVLDLQKVTNTVSIEMKFFHYIINVQAQTEDMYSSIDKAVEKLITLVKKYKNRLQNHKVKENPNAAMRVAVLEQISDIEEINDQISEENLKEEESLFDIHEVVDTNETMPLRMLTKDEAAMRFELAGDDFLIYKSEEDQKIKVMFRRKDDKIGLIQID